MNRELMEKIAKRKEKEEKEVVFEQPLSKRYVAKKALKGALTGAGVGAGLGSIYGTTFGIAGAPVVGFGNSYQDAKSKLLKAQIASVKKGLSIGSAVGAGAGALLGGVATATGAAKDRAFSQLPVERQKAIHKELTEAGDAFNEADKTKKVDKEKFNRASERFNTALNNYFAATKEGKAIIRDKKLNKTASFDYDEMVKLAYEDILGGFEKSAEENDAEVAKREQKKEMMKRLAATSALTAGATLGGVALYKKIGDSSNCYPKIKKFRGNIEKVTKGKPVVKLRNDEWEVAGSNTSPVKLLPLLSAGN